MELFSRFRNRGSLGAGIVTDRFGLEPQNGKNINSLPVRFGHFIRQRKAYGSAQLRGTEPIRSSKRNRQQPWYFQRLAGETFVAACLSKCIIRAIRRCPVGRAETPRLQLICAPRAASCLPSKSFFANIHSAHTNMPYKYHEKNDWSMDHAYAVWRR